MILLSQEIADVVDNYLICGRNSEDSLSELQVHKHSQSCRKRRNAVCRFRFLLPPI